MSKYIDSNNPVDVEKVEEHFQKGYESADKIAKRKAELLLEEIKHYKSLSYEELLQEVGNKEIKIDRKERILATDILYDLMTEEQVEQFVNLYYLSELKQMLINEKDQAIKTTARELGKKTNLQSEETTHITPDFVAPKEDYKWTVIEDAKKVTAVEPMDAKDLITKDKIIEKIKEGLKKIGLPTAIGIGAAGLIGGYANLVNSINPDGITAQYNGTPITIMEPIGDINILEGLLKTAPVILAIVLACFGVKKASEFMKDKRAIAEAKKFGLYDIIVDAINQKKEYDDYLGELKEEYGVAGEIGGRAVL